MELQKKSLEEFMQQTGSSAPAPGGGSIAAVTAASGAALIEMVANVTIGKEKFVEVEAEMLSVQQTASELRTRFLGYIDKDCDAFMAMMDAFKLPKTTDAEKEHRRKVLQDCYQQAALVPFNLGLEALQLFDLSKIVVTKGNRNAVTDGIMGAMNARLAIRSAFLNVRINLALIKDDEFVSTMESKMKDIESHLEEKEQAIIDLY